MWIGDIPFVLKILTLPERLLVALYFPAAYIVKLFPKKAGGKKWDKEKVNSGMRGNVSTYRLNTNDISDMVTGRLMPRPVGILASVIAVTFVGAKNVPLLLLPDIFDVRRHRVADALMWLKANNSFYSDIEISPERLEQLPISGIPDEILLNVRYAPDESILDREHAGYVPVDIGDDVDEDNDSGHQDVEEGPDELQEDGEDLPEVADGEERDMDVDVVERHAVLPEENEDSGSLGEQYDPAAFPLQAHGSVDVGGDSIPEADLFVNAAQKLLPAQKRDYGVRPGSTYVNEYPREVNGRRTDGGVANPNHLLGAFPCLFPYGYGGLEVDRLREVPYGAHIRWCLQYDDSRFRKDLHFVFQVFGVKQKREAAGSSCLQIRRSTFIANEAAFHRLTPEDFVKASREEANHLPISNPVIRSLRKQLTAVRARVMGTDESRIAIRAQVWGMILEFNPPTLWATVNLSDTGDPIAQVLAGQEIDLDNFIATAGPDSDMRSRTIANDPFAAAEFFHTLVGVLLEELFGIHVNVRGSIERKTGIVGPVNGYIGTVEAQARGTLHLHMLLWLRGAPVASVMKEALGTQEFRAKVKKFISQNIRAHIANTDATTLLALPVERNIAYSRPEDPRTPEYPQRAARAEARIARAVQPHECKPFTCLKVKRGRLVCKRRAPWRTAEDDWVEETGDWGPKRLFNKINAWNPAMLQVTRCNQDMKLVTNGAETKDITFYITLYIAKRQIQAANASALLAKSTAFEEKYRRRNIDSERRNKLLLQRCTNTLSRQHEFSAPEVISYLMGWGDRYISHTYVKVYWDQITAQLRRTFPNLVVSQTSHGLESTMTMAAPTAAEDTVGVLTQNEEGVFVLKDQLREYEDRGEALENMNLYDYFRRTYDGKKIAAVEDHDGADNSNDNRRGGGRRPSERVPYRAGKRPNRCRVIRGWKQEVHLHFIGRWFPRNEEASREYYCAQMLLLLSPWRDLRCLPKGHRSFGDAFAEFFANASAEQKQIIENIKYFYECSDRATQRREEELVAEQQRPRGEGEEGQRSVDPAAPTVSLAQLRQPTDADIERARQEKYAARERIYGQEAVDIALERGIFNTSYAAVPPKPVASQATLEDAVKYEEWGNTLAKFVKLRGRGHASEDPPSEGGAVVAGTEVEDRRGADDAGAVVDITEDSKNRLLMTLLNTGETFDEPPPTQTTSGPIYAGYEEAPPGTWEDISGVEVDADEALLPATDNDTFEWGQVMVDGIVIAKGAWVLMEGRRFIVVETTNPSRTLRRFRWRYRCRLEDLIVLGQPPLDLLKRWKRMNSRLLRRAFDPEPGMAIGMGCRVALVDAPPLYARVEDGYVVGFIGKAFHDSAIACVRITVGGQPIDAAGQYLVEQLSSAHVDGDIVWINLLWLRRHLFGGEKVAEVGDRVETAGSAAGFARKTPGFPQRASRANS
ncbi:ATP-dependent DNA helicase [Mycena chlorophos]|uniref:ATP-dependent DNA helicase n=1 Tax=Mycena chlorophos TaxID=658473 RepID=A0A8H6VV63_MYCCL|nr:ATP-dependent DNA helicase [Mycena chlorophos]